MPIEVGKISTKFPNRLEVDNILLNDIDNDTLLSIDKVILHISLFNLLNDEIKINNLTLGNPTVQIKRKTETSPTNAQFLIDLLTKTDSTPSTPLPRIKVNQLHIYNGTFSYDVLSMPQAGKGVFDPAHININDFRATLSLKELTSDSLHLQLRHLNGRERSGVNIVDATALIKASSNRCNIEKFRIKFPDGEIALNGTTYATYSINETTKIPQDIYINGNITSKRFNLNDLSAILPIGNKLPTALHFNIPTIYYNNSISMHNANIATCDNAISVNYNLFYDKKALKLNIVESNITTKGIDNILTLNDAKEHKIPVNDIGNISINGDIEYTGEEVESVMNIESGAGEIYCEIKPNATGGHNCALQGNAIKLGNLLNNKELGNNANAKINITCNSTKDAIPQGEITSYITNFTYKDYKYAPIRLTATIKNKEIQLQGKIEDKNITSGALATVDLSESTPRLLLNLTVDTIRPYNLALTKHKRDNTLSFLFNSELNSYSKNINIDSLIYKAEIKNLVLRTPEKYRKIDYINVLYNSDGKSKLLSIYSMPIKGHLAGEYTFGTLHNSFLKLLNKHTPSLIKYKPLPSNNNFVFEIEIEDSEIFEEFIDLPFSISEQSNITIKSDDASEQASLDCSFNEITINNNTFNNITINAEHKLNGIYIETTAKDDNSTDNKDRIHIEYKCLAHNDSLKNIFDFCTLNNEDTINTGKLRIDAAVSRSEDQTLLTSVHIPGSTVLYNGNRWHISDTKINSDGDNINIDNCNITKDSCMIALNGAIGKENSDSLNIKLRNIILEEILDIVNFHSVSFGGITTGNINLRGLLGSPQFDSKLQVNKFKFEDGYMGDLSVVGDWQEEEKAVRLQGVINDKEYTSIIKGIVSPANDSINLQVTADGTRLDFLNYMINSIVSSVDMRAYGDIGIRGKLSSINLYGDLKTVGELKINSTNTTYNLYGEDTLHLTHNRIGFDNFRIYDHRNNKGIINGSVDHQSLKNFSCNFNINANNMLAYHTQDFNDDGFYGTAYITGGAQLQAGKDGLRISADVSAESGSRFVYNSSGPIGAANNNFVTFVDRNAHNHSGSKSKNELTGNNEEETSNLHLEFRIAVDPNIQLRVYTNTATNDYIDIYGSGTIDVIHDNKEDFKMAGNLDIRRGTYKFSVMPLFSKEFALRSGSIKFNGNPFDATLDIHAAHTVSSVRLSDLDPTAGRRNNVKVDCLMDITGTLKESILNFALDLPEGNEEEREFLASATGTPEQTNTQFMYLVALGKFYTYNSNVNDENQSSTMIESLISSAISGQVNNVLSQMTDNDNLDISGNFITNEKGWNSIEVEGTMTYRLFNNRLIINAYLSYRDNPYNNRNFIGDFDVRYLLDKKGIFNFKGYSKTNDRYFSRTDLTTQGVGLIIHHNFNNWLWWKKRKKKKDNEQKN